MFGVDTKFVVLLDIDSVECEDEIDRNCVNDIVEKALSCGRLYPPILVTQIDTDEYLLFHGANTLSAAKKLRRKDPSRFDDKIQAYIVESGSEAEEMAEQAELAA